MEGLYWKVECEVTLFFKTLKFSILKRNKIYTWSFCFIT